MDQSRNGEVLKRHLQEKAAVKASALVQLQSVFLADVCALFQSRFDNTIC